MMYFLGNNVNDVNFCNQTADVWQLVGKILFVFKIVIPILVLIFGMIDLGKAVVASKDDEIKKAAKSLGMRAIAGILIFFIPSIVSFAFSVVGSFQGEVNDDYNICKSCVTSPNGSDCKTHVESNGE